MPSADAGVDRHRAHRVVERGVLARMPGRRHPVGRQLDVDRRAMSAAAMLVIASPTAMRPDAGASISASGVRSPIAIASPAMPGEIHERHGDVGDRHLPRPDHRIARAQAADRAVADGDEERLVGHRGQLQHAIDRVVSARHADEVERPAATRCRCAHVARHLRRLAEDHVERHVDRPVAEVRVARRRAGRPRSPCRPRRTGSARARRSPRTPASDDGAIAST